MNNIKNFVDCFPHLFVLNLELIEGNYNSNFTTYSWQNQIIASAIHEDTKSNNDYMYKSLIEKFEESNFSQTDIVKDWLFLIFNRSIGNSFSPYKENINSIFKIIDLLDSSMYENHFQNTNLVFTEESFLDFDPYLDEHRYITNIDFSSNVFLQVTKNEFQLNEITITSSFNKNDNLYIPKKFENYSDLLKLIDNLLFTFHYMSNGDVYILSKYNIDNSNDEKSFVKSKSLTMIASRRNNKWTCYDNTRLEKVFFHRFKKKTIGKNLLKVAFELSQQRKGGLIIYDIENTILDKVLNEDYSLIKLHKIGFMSEIKEIINSSKTGLSINQNSFERLKVLMMMDGCVIFNDEGLTSVGSILSLTKKRGIYNDITGARSAASLFAHELNGRVLKISQNGTISLFTEYDKTKIILEFL